MGDVVSLSKKKEVPPFARALRDHMRARGWNAPDLEQHSGVSLSTIRSLLKGEKAPSMNVLDRLAMVLGDGIDVFSDGTQLSGDPLMPFTAHSISAGMTMVVALNTTMPIEAYAEMLEVLHKHGVDLRHRRARTQTQLRLRF